MRQILCYNQNSGEFIYSAFALLAMVGWPSSRWLCSSFFSGFLIWRAKGNCANGRLKEQSCGLLEIVNHPTQSFGLPKHYIAPETWFYHPF